MIKLSKFGAGIGASSHEQRLQEAADIHINLGNIQKYCEIMIELGKVSFYLFYFHYRCYISVNILVIFFFKIGMESFYSVEYFSNIFSIK